MRPRIAGPAGSRSRRTEVGRREYSEYRLAILADAAAHCGARGEPQPPWGSRIVLRYPLGTTHSALLPCTTVYTLLRSGIARHARFIQHASDPLVGFGTAGCAADFRQYMEAYFDQKWDER